MVTTLKKIYLESTALFQLGPRFENVDFEKLLELRGSAGFTLLVSEVSWQEYLRHRRIEVNAFLDSCSKTERLLEKHGKSIAEIGNSSAKVAEYLSGIDAHYRARVKQKGIEIIPLAHIKIERLLEMSIDSIPPFEGAADRSKEKGFRDSLIMFSILESLRGMSTEPAMVVTNDKLLAKAFELHATEYEANVIVVGTIDEAIAHVSETILESERLRMKKEAAEAVAVLERYNEEIAHSISETSELSESDLGQTLLAALPLTPKGNQYLDIQGVQSISFDKIDSAIWKDKDKQGSRILFRCLCKAVVFVSAPHLRHLSGVERRFPVGKPAYMSIFSTVSPGEPTERKEMHLHFYGSAEFERSGSDWKLKQMRIDKSIPSEEEYYALVKAEISQSEK